MLSVKLLESMVHGFGAHIGSSSDWQESWIAVGLWDVVMQGRTIGLPASETAWKE